MKKIALPGMLLICLSMACQPIHREDIHRQMAMLYAIAWSYPERLPAYVNKHAGTFQSRAFQKETDRLIKHLENHTIEMPSTRNTYQQAVKISSEFDHPNLAGELHDTMLGEKMDSRKMARHFKDLKRSVKEVLTGDERFYKNSEIYNYSSVTWNMMQYNTSTQHTRAFQEMLYELNIWYIQNLLTTL
jgi:NADH dehydrogenase/NADH:ubiquinone oxidoreductase subunit G